jgi:hypothetical protein
MKEMKVVLRVIIVLALALLALLGIMVAVASCNRGGESRGFFSVVEWGGIKL